MKKNVWIFGGISGLIVTTIMVISTIICIRYENYEGSMALGYASMLIAFSMIFVGIKNYRDKYNHGIVSFGKAFLIGFYISLIASTIYVLVWMIEYYFFFPDFMDRYTEHMLNKMISEGASQQIIDEKTTEFAGYKEMYKNPLYVFGFTYIEVLPVGLIVSLIAALILKRENKTGEGMIAMAQ